MGSVINLGKKLFYLNYLSKYAAFLLYLDMYKIWACLKLNTNG